MFSIVVSGQAAGIRRVYGQQLKLFFCIFGIQRRLLHSTVGVHKISGIFLFWVGREGGGGANYTEVSMCVPPHCQI